MKPKIILIVLLLILAMSLLFLLRKWLSDSSRGPEDLSKEMLEVGIALRHDVNASKALSFSTDSAIEAPPIGRGMDTEDQEILKTAEAAAREHLSFPLDAKPIISHGESTVTVIWPIILSASVSVPKPGPDYYAKVVIDRKSKKVLQVLSGS